jgi:hypothetical protein
VTETGIGRSESSERQIALGSFSLHTRGGGRSAPGTGADRSRGGVRSGVVVVRSATSEV